MPDTLPQGGLTPRELARVLRVSPDTIRSWIVSGRLGAINTAPTRRGRPRFVILPSHLSDFARRNAAATTPKPAPRRRRQAGEIDYFPE
jgi:excisionase family DNA binding protein